MRYKTFGSTGLELSEISVGTWALGGKDMGPVDEKDAIEAIHAMIDQGVNFIDTAPTYGRGASETIVGKALASGKRSQVTLLTKCGIRWEEGPKNFKKGAIRDSSHDSIMKQVDESLKRLQTDYIDLGMIHYVDSEEEWEKIQHSDYLDYVMELKKNGTIRHIGISSHNPKVAVKAAQSGYVEMILFSINPAFDMLPASEDIETMFAEQYDTALKGIDAERAHLYQVCEQNDVGITVMKGFAGGRLFDEKRSPFGVKLTPVQCIHYALTRPAVCSILCGYDTKEQVDDAAAYETASDEAKDYASVIANAPLHSYRGACTYCGHCKPCVVNLDIAMINKFYDLATMQPEVPVTVQSHYELLEHKASECIGCRSCEERCPFGVKIAERMEKAAKVFGV